ncbi:EAL domain-containing protein [Erythrobacter sp. MTPC3]|uniref:EAL domain-containing protein n=1 Tax=Erythrobacter sp. MTPC3 TaxID=3056564 RepID=UPI0036F29081
MAFTPTHADIAARASALAQSGRAKAHAPAVLRKCIRQAIRTILPATLIAATIPLQAMGPDAATSAPLPDDLLAHSQNPNHTITTLDDVQAARKIGEELLLSGNLAEALNIVDAAADRAETIAPDHPVNADLHLIQGQIRTLLANYEDAFLAFDKARGQYAALGEKRNRALARQGIGALQLIAHDYEQALTSFEAAYNVFSDEAPLALTAHENRGMALQNLGRFDEANAQFRLALGIAGELRDAEAEARILVSIASIQLAVGQFAAAEETASQAVRLAAKSAPQQLPFAQGLKAQIFAARGDLERADRELAAVFEDRDIGQTPAAFLRLHEAAYQAYVGLGSYELAMAHLAAFNRLDRTIRETARVASNALLAARFNSESRDLRVSKLSAEKAANEARLSTERAKNDALIMLTALLVFLFVVTLVNLRIVSRNRAIIESNNEKLTYASQRDNLTNLYSRNHFRALLDQECRRYEGGGESGAFMLIDLDRFKQVNDIYGHAAGDVILVETAKRFRIAAGSEAVIGRLGGDEFGLFLPGPVTIGKASEVAADIIEAVSTSLPVEGKEIAIGASIGISAMGPQECSTSVVMTNADLALYEAKDRGRSTFAVYRPEMRKELESRAQLELDLRQALERGEITVSYQPIVDSGGTNVLCYEALMRWTHPERGQVPPREFIPIAEEALLIEPLGEWLLRTACEEACNWPDDVKLAVNISGLQLGNRKFLGTAVEALAASGLSPNRLVLELTESIVMDMDKDLEKLIKSLGDIGITFALDDFGHGHSSLNYVEKMNFSMIKFDRHFVEAATAGSIKSQAIVSAIVSLAQSLNMAVAAEGIEAARQADIMRALGCSCFQGFHFGVPSATVGDEASRGSQVA